MAVQRVFLLQKQGPHASQSSCSVPIIAICNDLYAAALRPLRFAARSVQLKKPLVSPDGHPCTSNQSLMGMIC